MSLKYYIFTYDYAWYIWEKSSKGWKRILNYRGEVSNKYIRPSFWSSEELESDVVREIDMDEIETYKAELL